MKRPSPLQYLGYVFGRRLPDEYREWVAHDLADHGAVRRHMLRYAIPPFLVLAPFWLLPASLQLDSATLSPMLKRLETLGLITRTRSATDERATDVELTKAGLQLRRKALKIPGAVIERLGVGLDELEHLHTVLTRINRAALAAGALEGER